MKIDGRIPLVLGVVGKQNITNLGQDRLVGLIKSILGHIQNRYPHTRVQIISPLNQGGNHLLEQAVLSVGIEVVFAIPKIGAAHNDMDDDERSSLASRARFCISLPEAICIDEKPGTGLSPDQFQYIQTYAFIARRCHILIAITDNGEDDRSISQVIKFKLTGSMDWVPPAYRIMKHHLYPPDQGPVIRIVSTFPQTHAPDTYEVQYLCPNATASHQYKALPFEIEDKAGKNNYPATLDKLDEYNADVISAGNKVSKKMTGFFTLLPDHLTGQLAPEQENIHSVYMYADMLAGYYQTKTRRITKSLYIFSSLMPLIFILYIRVWQKPPVIMLYVLLSLLVYLIYWLSRKRKYQIKHLDYRALAEGLRVQFFWRFFEMVNEKRTLNDKPGDHVIPSSVSDCYLRKQNNVLGWIRDAIRIVSTPHFNKQPGYGINDCISIIREYWIMDQARYYAKSALRDEHKSRQFDNIVLPLILAGGVTSLFLTGLFPFVAGQVMLKNILILCVGYLPAVGGLLKTYAFTMGYEEQARQYERMANDFNNASAELETGPDVDQFKLIIHELGKEALRENGDWVVLHRERPVKVPGAGKSNLIEASIKLHKRNQKN